MASEFFNLTIQTPTESFLEDQVYQLTIRLNNGYIGVLPGHTTMISNIKPCIFEIKRTDNSEVEKGVISSGIIHIDKKETSVICNIVFWENEINVEEVERDLETINAKIVDAKGVNLKNLLLNKEFYEIALRMKGKK